jgi:beta-lactamase class A
MMNNKLLPDEKINRKGGWWNRKIFILTVIFLIATNVATFIFYVYKEPADQLAQSKNLYPLINPDRSFIAQENFFSTIQPLRTEMQQIVVQYEKSGHRIGVYFEFLNTGSNISINQDSRFWPASLSKLPTALAVVKKIEKGEWRFSDELILTDKDLDNRFGELYKKPPGTRLTIETLLQESLINSDNTAHGVLVHNLRSEDYTDILEALGLEELFDKNYDITAKEYSRVFSSLYNASYLDREHSQKLLDLLARTHFESFIDEEVPPEVVFSHKIGEAYEQRIFLDSGIVYVPNRPYLITVLVQTAEGSGIEKAKEIMGELSKAAYNFVANN